MYTVYSTKNCPKCELLKHFLDVNHVSYQTADVENPDHLTDLMMNQIFSLSLPILKKNDVFYLYSDIFENDHLNETALYAIISEET